MVTVLPQLAPKIKAKPKGQQFAEAFSRLAQEGSEHLYQRELQKQQDDTIKQLTGQDVSGLSPEMKKQFLNEFTKQQAKYQNQLGLLKEFGLDLGGKEKPSTSRRELPSDIINELGEIEVGDVNVPRTYQENEIAAMALINPAVATQMRQHNDNVIQQKRHEEKLESSEVSQARKETMPLRKQIVDQAKFAKDSIKNKKNQLKLIEKGNIDSPERVFFASLLPGALGNKLLSSDTQLYRAGLFEEFGVLKSMFPGSIRVKEIELLEDKLASLEKSDEAKKKILETGIKKLEIPIIREKAARRVEKENPKASVLEFEELVDQYASEDLNRAYDDISKTYDKIYFEYAPAESTLIDENGQIYKNVPKHQLKQIYEEAERLGLDLRPL